MAGNGLKQLEMSVIGWKWLKVAGIAESENG